jgi:hypothetical protein
MIPANARAALCAMTPATGAAVVIAIPPVAPSLDALAAAMSAGRGMSAILTHDPGVTWPDAAGRRLLAEVLARGGIAVLLHSSMRDALAAHRRALAEIEAGR